MRHSKAEVTEQLVRLREWLKPPAPSTVDSAVRLAYRTPRTGLSYQYVGRVRLCQVLLWRDGHPLAYVFDALTRRPVGRALVAAVLP